MRAFASVVAIAQLLAAGVTSVRAQSVQEEAAARGKAIVEANCARCHAVGLEDASKHEKAPPFRDVVERYPSEDLAEALAEGIVSGHPDMPVFVFKPDEIEAFLAYLNALSEASEAGDSKK